MLIDHYKTCHVHASAPELHPCTSHDRWTGNIMSYAIPLVGFVYCAVLGEPGSSARSPFVSINHGNAMVKAHKVISPWSGKSLVYCHL